MRSRVARWLAVMEIGISLLGGWLPLARAEDRVPLTLFHLKLDVKVVTIPFSAKDSHNRFVEDLRREDLSFFEEDIQLPIHSLDFSSQPLGIVVLLDQSESMEEHAEEIKAATRILLELLQPGDQVAIVRFSGLPEMVQPFTSDLVAIQRAIQQAGGRFAGPTNINDSVYFASRLTRDLPAETRKVLFLISDGHGNRGEEERAWQELRNSHAILLGLAVGTISRRFGGAEILHRMVRETGGTIAGLARELTGPPEEMWHQFRRVRSRYLLGFSPTPKKGDEQFHRLRLEINSTSPFQSRGISFNAPSGYVVDSPEGTVDSGQLTSRP
jgi:VWFA-related protein